MKAFTGTFTFKVDKKGRVSVPAEYRAVLAERGGSADATGLLVFPWFPYPAIRGVGLETMDRLAESLSPNAVFENAPVDSAQISAADMMPLTFDGEGRIVLPRDLMEHAGLREAAAFVGQISYFEIWEPGAFRQHQAARRALRNTNPGA